MASLDLNHLNIYNITFLIVRKIDDTKTLDSAFTILDKYKLELCGNFVNADGTFTPAFDEENWGYNGSIIHRLLQGPERHGDVQGILLEYYLSEEYLSKCSDWLKSMTPEVLRKIEIQMWH
jgi:hypothetical protein